MTYRQKLERCGYHLRDDVTEDEAKVQWDELAEEVDIWATGQFLINNSYPYSGEEKT